VGKKVEPIGTRRGRIFAFMPDGWSDIQFVFPGYNAYVDRDHIPKLLLGKRMSDVYVSVPVYCFTYFHDLSTRTGIATDKPSTKRGWSIEAKTTDGKNYVISLFKSGKVMDSVQVATTALLVSYFSRTDVTFLDLFKEESC
jgi:hypothetical protein